MTPFFYMSALVAVLSTFMAMIAKQAVHALLYFVLSLLALALILFDLGAPFAAALEVIIYAGAIMVLFVFVVMLVNPAKDITRRNLMFPGILALALAVEMIWMSSGTRSMPFQVIETAQVTRLLFQEYSTLVELASFLLLAGLVAAYRIGRK